MLWWTSLEAKNCLWKKTWIDKSVCTSSLWKCTAWKSLDVEPVYPGYFPAGSGLILFLCLLSRPFRLSIRSMSHWCLLLLGLQEKCIFVPNKKWVFSNHSGATLTIPSLLFASHHPLPSNSVSTSVLPLGGCGSCPVCKVTQLHPQVSGGGALSGVEREQGLQSRVAPWDGASVNTGWQPLSGAD